MVVGRFPCGAFAMQTPLDEWRRDQGTFDWVVGNPPYVRIQHLEADRRKKIRNGGWKYFRGASDMYIIFFELGLHLLRDEGNLVYISPSGWLRNEAGKVLRKNLKLSHGIRALYDFGNHQVFPGVSTYTCISHIRKGNPGENTAAYRYTGERFTGSCRLVQSDSGWARNGSCFRAVQNQQVQQSCATLRISM